VWLLGTPPTREDIEAEMGQVFGSIRAAAIGKTSTAAAWAEWGADPEDPAFADLRKTPRVWTSGIEALCWSGNPAWNTRINHEVVQGEFDSYTPEEFGQDRLGMWLDDVESTGVIDMDAWREREGVLVPPVRPVVLAIETTVDRAQSVIVAVGSGEDEVPQVRVVDAQARTAWVPRRVVDVITDHPEVTCIVMDDRDSADPVADAVELALEAAGLQVDIVRMNYPDTAEACALTFDLVHEGEMRHAGDPLLDAAMRGAVKQENEGAFVWSRRKGGSLVAPLVAMTRGLWEWKRRVAAEYDVMDSVL